jgi:hypothetical protein
MPNGVKYSTTTPTGALRKDNVALGVNGNLGPTANTGFYSMPTPASGKYIINKVAASGVPLFFAPQNDTELIQFARNEGATGDDTSSAAAVLAWIATQPNLEAANFEYENIVTDGLIMNLDAGFVGSYPTIGTTWYDLSGNNNNGTLTNGPTFNSANSGSIVFDGVNDYALISGVNSTFGPSAIFTVNIWIYTLQIGNRTGIWGKNDAYEFGYISSGVIQFWSPSVPSFNISINNNDYLNQWKMITTTNSSNGSFVYTNSTLIGTNLQHSGNSEFDFGVMSGTFDPPGTSPLAGRVGSIQVYNRVLSQAEILQNYNAQKGRFGL